MKNFTIIGGDEKYSVFYKYGDEANDNYLTKKGDETRH